MRFHAVEVNGRWRRHYHGRQSQQWKLCHQYTKRAASSTVLLAGNFLIDGDLHAAGAAANNATAIKQVPSNSIWLTTRCGVGRSPRHQRHCWDRGYLGCKWAMRRSERWPTAQRSPTWRWTAGQWWALGMLTANRGRRLLSMKILPATAETRFSIPSWMTMPPKPTQAESARQHRGNAFVAVNNIGGTRAQTVEGIEIIRSGR